MLTTQIQAARFKQVNFVSLVMWPSGLGRIGKVERVKTKTGIGQIC